MSFKGGFERGRRIRTTECLRQTVPNRLVIFKIDLVFKVNSQVLVCLPELGACTSGGGDKTPSALAKACVTKP